MRADLPTALYDADGVRALDACAIREHGVDGFELMMRAGKAAYAVLRRSWPGARRIAVVCGSGNNGGDGYVIAKLAAGDGIAVVAAAVGQPRSSESLRARDEARAAGARILALDDAVFEGAELIVDALLGTGLARAPEGVVADAIDRINAHAVPKFALDIPSGLAADSGHAPGVVVRAAATSTFIALKLGLFTGIGPEVVGDLHFHSLDVPNPVYRAASPRAERIDRPLVHQWLPRRGRCAHKGTQGHVVLVGGNDGMTGALRIAAEAAARCGAGLVTAVTRARNASFVNIGQPEIMVSGLDDAARIDAVLKGRQALGIGPGLGRDDWASSLFLRAASSTLPKVVDADGLNLLAGSGGADARRILTPHPGEAGRLLALATADVARDRPSAVRAIVARYGGVCVLKGCGTIVADASSMFVCDRGNPGMATGGMGDCLTGVLTALLGQGLDPLRAAVCGVWLHASAGDLEAESGGKVGIMATDLFPWLRRLLGEVRD